MPAKKVKTYPSHALADALRAQNVGVRLLWEISGPENTPIAWLSCYQVSMHICIVETFHDSGWQAFTPNMENDTHATVKDVMNRCATGASVVSHR